MTVKVVTRRTAKPVTNGSIRVYVGRPSPLGNPFPLGPATSRAHVISQYRDWIARNEQQPEIAAALEQIRQLSSTHTVELECWCSPEPCHAEVIRDWVTSHEQEGA